MTQAIIDDESKKKDVYEFLEDDDDFEEFEMDQNGDEMMVDTDLQEEGDKKLW
jgi:hypothetical protein